ncbi:hypothetical protein ACLB2K_074753 [Fragaria x ananassa]
MKTAPVAWKEVCKPKMLGGLGVRPSTFFNKAAIAKLAWKLVTDKNNWWVQVASKKYLRRCSFFDAKKKHKNSMAWNGILDSRDLILKVVKEIMRIPIPANQLEDNFIWALLLMASSQLNQQLGCNSKMLMNIAIWKARNEMIFRGKTPSIRATMAAVTSHLQNTFCLTNAHLMPQGNKMDIRWFHLSHDRVKINFDGSVRNNSAAGGFIVRTETGKSLAAACFNLGTTTILVAEVIALRNSLIYVKNQGLAKIEVEGDSKLVIDVVNGVREIFKL